MLLHEIVETSKRVREARGRLEKIEHLAACLRRATPDEVAVAAAYLSGETPQARTGIGYARLQEARPGTAPAQSVLQLADVHATLDQIAALSGPGSSGARARLLGELFARATAEEQEFLFRLLTGELRQGALQGVMIEAVARAAQVDAAALRRAVMLAGELGPVARAVLEEGAAGLARFSVQLFRPVQPMLADTAESPADALVQLGGGEAAFEHKLDGARIQVHRAGAEVRVFTRRLNEVTDSAPEVADAVRALPLREVVLDGEAIALRADGRPLPFQVTMSRFSKKLDVAAARGEAPLTPVFFDCLWLDGRSLMERPAAERWEALAGVLPETMRVPRLVTADGRAADAFLHDALARGHEGVMAKSPGASYEAGRRGANWLKIKPTRTLDLVVLAAEWGHGRRRGWLSNLHLGARDPATGGFVMLGKTFKGMTDEMLAWQTEKLRALAVEESEWVVRVRPELVVEVAFNDVQSSPHYPGGVALRFARVKGYRPDKRPEDADTIDAVRAIHDGQRG